MEAFISKNYNISKQDGVHRVLIEMLSGKCINDIDIEKKALSLSDLRRLQVSRRLLNQAYSAIYPARNII